VIYQREHMERNKIRKRINVKAEPASPKPMVFRWWDSASATSSDKPCYLSRLVIHSFSLFYHSISVWFLNISQRSSTFLLFRIISPYTIPHNPVSPSYHSNSTSHPLHSYSINIPIYFAPFRHFSWSFITLYYSDHIIYPYIQSDLLRFCCTSPHFCIAPLPLFSINTSPNFRLL
jgi:hypothetical protein